jgi:putative chitobiose transport system substrate-binding protein
MVGAAVKGPVQESFTRRAIVKAGAAGVAVVPALAAAACAPGPQPARQSRPAVSLIYTYDHTDLPQTVGAWYRWMIQRFADEFPGSTAELQLVKSTPELITVSVAGGKPAADAVYLRLFDARELWDAGVLAELTTMIRKYKELAPSSYFPSANDYRTLGNKLFAIPNYVNTEMIWVNSRMLKENGLDPKAADLKTWDDLRRYDQALAKRDGSGKYTQLGHPLSSIAWQGLSAYIYANGGQVQNADVTKALFKSPETEQALQFLRDMYQSYGNPALWADNLRQTGVDNFQNEMWAIRDRSFGFARPSRATPGWFPSGADSWVIPVPMGPKNKGRTATMWVNQMGIPKGVPNPEMSFELLRCGVDVQGQTVMHRLAQWEPSMPAYYQSDAFKEELRKDSLLQVGLDSFKVGKTFPFYRRYTAISKDAFPPLLAAIKGERDIKSALDESERLHNQILSGPG